MRGPKGRYQACTSVIGTENRNVLIYQRNSKHANKRTGTGRVGFALGRQCGRSSGAMASEFECASGVGVRLRAQAEGCYKLASWMVAHTGERNGSNYLLLALYRPA